MVKSVYIHIPFCKSKCHYCSFVSFDKLELKRPYLIVLENEINFNYENELLATLYFGGGTPSLLTSGEFSNLIKHFKISDITEITSELNPEGVEYDYMRELFDIGINRISLGCQTFDDRILKQINRRHNSLQVMKAVEMIQDVGFKNVSLDFIYGLPNQTPEMFYKDLETAISLGIQHISLYGLKFEEGCYFYNNKPENLPDDDIQADMYLGAVELLKRHKFIHYEVSNFAKKGFESKHNLNYWNNEEYYGFGVSAHGYKNGIRYADNDTLEGYIKDPLKHIEEKFLSPQEKLEEEIFLGLRKMKGINISEINDKFGIDFNSKYKEILNKYLKLKLLSKTPLGYKFTSNGILVSNVVLADFIE